MGVNHAGGFEAWRGLMRYLCTSHARAPHIGGTILEPKLATPEPHSGPPGGTLSVEQAMRTARELYRRTLWECWPLALAAALVSTAMDVYVARRDGGSSNDLAQLIRVYSLPEVQALNLLQTVLSLAFFGGLIALQYDALVGRKVRGVRAAFATGFGRLGHAALISVLWCAMVVAGLLLLIVPGVYWSGALSLWPVALFAENAQGTTPLTYSRECVKGHWWAVSTVLSIPKKSEPRL